jgi:hypothetical protein
MSDKIKPVLPTPHMVAKACPDCAMLAKGTRWRGSPPKCPKHRQKLVPGRRVDR